MPNDTEVQQLIIYVGTQAKIDEARQQGTIGPDDFVVVTDAPELQTKLTSANAGTGISITEVGGVVKISNTQTSAEWGNIQGPISSQTDLWNYLSEIGVLSNLTTTEKATLVGAINEVNSTAGSALQPSDVINNTASTVTDKPLSANMGKSLQDQVDNLKARGRFLALWNCATGLAQSNPPESPYTYQSGDYFIVGTISSADPAVNYKPNGSTYTTGIASVTVETNEVAVDDVYYYDGTNWRLQSNTQKTVSFVNIAGDPYDNTNLASTLNNKISGVKVNGTELTPDADKKVNVSVPTQASDINAQPTLVSGTNIKTVNGNSLLGSGDLVISGLPSQTSQSGKFLTTNGTSASWANIPTEIPSQSGQSGKFLTTNGSAVSWATVDALPSQTGNSGKYLTTNGTTASWGEISEYTAQEVETLWGSL